MMKILIVHDKAIEASKLKLVLAKYGTCEIAPGGNEAIDMSRKAHEAGAPYGFMAVEMDMEEMMGNEVAAAVRMWESEHPDAPKTKFLVILTESDQQMYGLPLDAAGIPQLVKPFNRKKMEEVLQANGLEKKEEPPPPPTPTPKKKAAAPAASAAPKKPVDPEELKRQEAKRKQLEVILNQLKALITDADQLQDIESRQALEELVKKGGKQAQLLMGQYINSPQLPLHTRMELIRSASYIRSPLFLVPLNRVIDTEDNIRLVERALVSISKYSDQRALNILGNALKKIRNPMLLNTVRREVAKIKQDNPVLAILPRFLQSHKSLKTFRVTLDILKKIVTPKDTHLFVNYLRAGNETLELGTFELLCFTGDIAVKDSILVFFEDRITKITCLAQPECDPLYRLVLSMHQYLLQNPLLIDAQLENFKAFFGSINDIRARQLVSSILCHSQKTEALEFVKTVYAEAEDLREWIIEKLAGNLAAVDFLFERYHEGGDFQDKIIASLLKSERGLHYFVDHFFSFELERQEFIIKQLPFSDNPFLVEFIRKIYETKLFSLKSYLLTVIRDNFLFSFKDILFDPANQREFMFMGDVFLETISRLFPISSMWMFFDKIANEDNISISKMKKFLAVIQKVGAAEPVIRFKDMAFIQALFKRVYNANNVELNTQFFTAFENMKALDLRTYKYLLDAAGSFIQNRGVNITDPEKGAATKLKQRLLDQYPDIRGIENLYKELKAIFANKPVNLENLGKLLKTNHTSVALNIDKVCIFMAGRLRKAEYISPDDRELFVMQFPIIGKFIEYLWDKGFDKVLEWENITTQPKVLKHYVRTSQIVINFNKKGISALLKDQLLEAMPEFDIVLDKEQPEASDILICDTDILHDYVDKRTLSVRRIFLYLENRMDYAPFRELLPKAFMRPLSGYRVVKLVLKDLFL